jgi:hypothetical protein
MRGSAITQANVSGTKGLFLLFHRGKRPDRLAIREFVACRPDLFVSHDPAGDVVPHLVASDGETVAQQRPATENTTSELVWLELLRDGLVFDLSGLAPGAAVRFPVPEHLFDLDETPSTERYDVLHLAPGHHLAGGERTMPVAKALFGLARDFVDHFEDIAGVVWPPASSAIGQRFFESVVSAWLQDGPFPALGLVAFAESIDGALQSEGLDFWIGQELRIEPALVADKVAATRLGVRLVNQLVLIGGIESSERAVAPDGSRLVMRTSRNGRFVRVWRE